MTMDDEDQLAREFETYRAHLRAVAYRMLGSLAEADDAVQESWLRLSRSDSREIENLGGWLTTVVSRVCLDMLRSRKSRREDAFDEGRASGAARAGAAAGAARAGSRPAVAGGDGGTPADYVQLPDPIVGREGAADPEQQVLLADAVGLALLVVLETLPPAERLAFVLHDMFAVPFDEIGPIVGRSPTAARKLASRARQRVQGAAARPDPDLGRQRQVVDAFFAAARDGDFAALVAVLDPDVVLRADAGPGREGSGAVHGARNVAEQAFRFRAGHRWVRPALVNGVAGVVFVPEGRLASIMAFTVVDGRIVAIDALSDPDRLADVDLTLLAEG
jgi:RNA polymerase sigma-70 factor (ECF subfamily)